MCVCFLNFVSFLHHNCFRSCFFWNFFLKNLQSRQLSEDDLLREDRTRMGATAQLARARGTRAEAVEENVRQAAAFQERAPMPPRTEPRS